MLRRRLASWEGAGGWRTVVTKCRATIERYLAVRDGIDAGNGTWADLAQFFTDDAVFIDPAWGGSTASRR